jgi:hypothetical protein
MNESEDDLQGTGEILKASGPDAVQIRPGIAVVGIDGERIGKVKEVRDGKFLVNRPLARDLWVPFTSVVEAGEHGGSFRRGPRQADEVVLIVMASDVDHQGWEHG